MAALLSSLADIRDSIESEPRHLRDPGLSRALLVGLLVLARYPEDGSYMRNADVATELGLSDSTVHRYARTLVTAGLLVRDPATRQCRLAR